MNPRYNYKQNDIDITTGSILFGRKETQLAEENISASGADIKTIEGYTYIFPDSLNIFKNYSELEKVKSEKVKKQATEFLDKLQNLLFIVKNKINFSGSLPSLSIKPTEDETLLIEWIFKDFRIGFDFEENDKESSWFLVSNEKFGNVNYSGSFLSSDIYKLLEQLITIVMTNQ